MTLEKYWLEYKNRVMEPDCSQIQYDECQNAFYGGFVQCLFAVSTLPDGMPEDEAVRIFSKWKKELADLIDRRRDKK